MIVAGEDTGRTGLLFLGLQALSSRPEKSGSKKLAQRNEVKLGLSDYEVNDFPGSQYLQFSALWRYRVFSSTQKNLQSLAEFKFFCSADRC